MLGARVVVRPMNYATLVVPFVYAIERNGVASFKLLNSGSEVDVVRYE
jgi:hypothetical protein